MEPRLRFSRWVYYGGALLHALACSGAIFGWSNMAYLLGKEGVYATKCTATPAPCAEQTLEISTMYSVASVFSFCVPALSGLFQDRFGPRATIRILSLVFAGGVALLLGAASGRGEGLYYPAFAAMGAAAPSNILPLYSVATLFPESKALALSVLSGSFDAGTIVFLVFARLYDGGWSFPKVVTGYLLGPVAVQLLMALFLWPAKPFDAYKESVGQAEEEEEVSVPRVTVDVLPQEEGKVVTGVDHNTQAPGHTSLQVRIPPSGVADASTASGDPQGATTLKRAPSLVDAVSAAASTALTTAFPSSPSAGGGRGYARLEVGAGGGAAPSSGGGGAPVAAAAAAVVAPPSSEGGGDDGPVREWAVSVSPRSPRKSADGKAGEQDAGAAASTLSRTPPAHGRHDATPTGAVDTSVFEGQARSMFMPSIDSPALSRLPFASQLRSPEYAYYLAFFVACLVRFNFYIASVGNQLDAMGQKPDASYSKLFGYILPCGFFFNLIIGGALDRHGPVLGLTAVWVLGLVVSVLAMIPVLQVQIITFLVFTAFRGTIFCVMTVYLSAVFGFGTLGSLVGILTAVGGIVGLTQNALLVWALGAPGGSPDFLPPNAFLLGVMALCGLFPAWLAQRSGHDSLLAALVSGGRPCVVVPAHATEGGRRGGGRG